MTPREVTPGRARRWLEHLADYGVVPPEMKAHVVLIAVEYLRLAEAEPRMFDPLDYMFRGDDAQRAR